MRTPPLRRTRGNPRRFSPRSPADGGSMLAGIGCVLVALLLYGMTAMLVGIGADDDLESDERPARSAKLRR